MPDLQTTDHLVNDHRNGTAIRDASFDSFRNQFAETVGFVRRHPAWRRKSRHRCFGNSARLIRRHGAERSHAAVRLESAALIQDQFARTLVSAREQRADHDGARACGNGLADIAGILDAAIGNDRNARIARGAVGLGDGGDLRHPGAGNHARGAYRTRADANFDSICASFGQLARTIESGDVAGDADRLPATSLFTALTASSTRLECP